jgi:hypothetical protein
MVYEIVADDLEQIKCPGLSVSKDIRRKFEKVLNERFCFFVIMFETRSANRANHQRFNIFSIIVPAKHGVDRVTDHITGASAARPVFLLVRMSEGQSAVWMMTAELASLITAPSQNFGLSNLAG